MSTCLLVLHDIGRHTAYRDMKIYVIAIYTMGMDGLPDTCAGVYQASHECQLV